MRIGFNGANTVAQTITKQVLPHEHQGVLSNSVAAIGRPAGRCPAQLRREVRSMKALVQSALGEPADVLKFVDIDDPQLAPGDILIDVTLAPVHHGDLQLIRVRGSIPEDVGFVRRGSSGSKIGTVSC